LIDKAKLTALVPVDNGAIQLVQNPDFETGDFSHWISSGGTAYLDNVIEQPAGGKWVAVVASTGGDYPQIQSDSMPVVAGKSYRFGCWGRNAGSNTTDRVARLELIGTGTVLWLIFDAASHPSDTWAWHETTWVAPSDGLVYILAYFGGVATPAGQWGCWDGFVFEEIPPDPPVGPVATNEASVWTHILTAAYDALYAAWMDRYGTLRFRSFGNPSDSGFQAGGADGIPISNMKTQGSLQGVYTRIVAYDDDAPTVPVTAFDATKASIYGDILLHRQQPVPNGQAWVDSVLADRSGSALQYVPGTLYPQTEDDLEDILELGMVDIAHLVVESVDPSIDVAARVLGGTINADTGTGWTAQIAAYIPAKEWEEAEAPIPPIEPPPPDTVSGVVRTYACIADARLAHSGSLDAGNGQDVQLPIGYIGGYRNRAVLAFAAIPLGDVVSIDKAELVVKIGGNNCGAFGSEPKVQVSRITGGWSEGSYNVSCGFATSNSVKYPGPGITSSGAVTTTVPKSTGSEKAIDITAIARAWHSGSGQYGVMVKSAGEDTSKYTTCFYSRHHGTSGNRPFLRLTLTVNA
jgi:hypothetical protein